MKEKASVGGGKLEVETYLIAFVFGFWKEKLGCIQRVNQSQGKKFGGKPNLRHSTGNSAQRNRSLTTIIIAELNSFFSTSDDEHI